MEWLVDFLKSISGSRSFTGATFVTALSLLMGPTWWSKYFSPLPKEWVLPTTAILVFSGVLLSLWAVAAIWEEAQWFLQKNPHLFKSKITRSESTLMILLAESPDESMDLANLNGIPNAISKLELREVAATLARKGLIEVNMFGQNFVSLTPYGRRSALKLMKTIITSKRNA